MQLRIDFFVFRLICRFAVVQVTKGKKDTNRNTAKSRRTGRKVATNTSRNGDTRRVIEFERIAEIMMNAVIIIILNKFPFSAYNPKVEEKNTH